MKVHTAKVLSNILSGFILSSAERKKFRLNLMSKLTMEFLPLFEILRNKILNNQIIIIDSKNRKRKIYRFNGLKVDFRGKNSKVIIHSPAIFTNSLIEVGNNCHIEIQNSIHRINNLVIITANKSEIYIGNNFSCVGCKIENRDEAGKIVSIGDDCMFSYDIIFRTSDGHAIYDLENNRYINTPQKGIEIGNHVWIGMGVSILKDVSICDNTIIGAKSLVTKGNTHKTTILAGTPAKTLKQNVGWTRQNTDSHTT